MHSSRLLGVRGRIHDSPRFGQNSNRSIVLQTFDKLLPDTTSYEENLIPNTQYSHFSRHLQQYKNNLIGLIDRSKAQKQQHFDRILKLTNESLSRISKSKSTQCPTLSDRSQVKSMIMSSPRNSDVKPNHELKPSMSPFRSRVTIRSAMKQKTEQSRLDYSNSVFNSPGDELGETQRLKKRKQELEQELQRLNRCIQNRQQCKAQLW